MTAQNVLNFWFQELTGKDRFSGTKEIDNLIAKKFSTLHFEITRSEHFNWRKSAEGRLAEIIVLDQFSRNLFRGEPRSFYFDGQALVLAQEAVANGCDQSLPTDYKSFLYMPYMHSESAAIHKIAIELFSGKGLEGTLEFEIKHKKIIDRFGRYPHRNQILGRSSTVEETDFLKEPNSSF